METDGSTIFMWSLTMVCIGMILGALLVHGSSVIVGVDVLDEVCVELFGNNTEFVDTKFLGVQYDFVCEKIPVTPILCNTEKTETIILRGGQ